LSLRELRTVYFVYLDERKGFWLTKAEIPATYQRGLKPSEAVLMLNHDYRDSNTFCLDFTRQSIDRQRNNANGSAVETIISDVFFLTAEMPAGRAADGLPENADKKYCSKVLAKSAKVG
jgi:hypothetical protein